jgi:hypothetical protein
MHISHHFDYDSTGYPTFMTLSLFGASSEKYSFPTAGLPESDDEFIARVGDNSAQQLQAKDHESLGI